MMNIFVKHPDKKQFIDITTFIGYLELKKIIPKVAVEHCKKAVKQLKSSEEKEFIKSLQLMFEDFRIINYIPNSTSVLKI